MVGTNPQYTREQCIFFLLLFLCSPARDLFVICHILGTPCSGPRHQTKAVNLAAQKRDACYLAACRISPGSHPGRSDAIDVNIAALFAGQNGFIRSPFCLRSDPSDGWVLIGYINNAGRILQRLSYQSVAGVVGGMEDAEVEITIERENMSFVTVALLHGSAGVSRATQRLADIGNGGFLLDL